MASSEAAKAWTESLFYYFRPHLYFLYATEQKSKKKLNLPNINFDGIWSWFICQFGSDFCAVYTIDLFAKNLPTWLI